MKTISRHLSRMVFCAQCVTCSLYTCCQPAEFFSGKKVSKGVVFFKDVKAAALIIAALMLHLEGGTPALMLNLPSECNAHARRSKLTIFLHIYPTHQLNPQPTWKRHKAKSSSGDSFKHQVQSILDFLKTSVRCIKVVSQEDLTAKGAEGTINCLTQEFSRFGHLVRMPWGWCTKKALDSWGKKLLLFFAEKQKEMGQLTDSVSNSLLTQS